MGSRRASIVVGPVGSCRWKRSWESAAFGETASGGRERSDRKRLQQPRGDQPITPGRANLDACGLGSDAERPDIFLGLRTGALVQRCGSSETVLVPERGGVGIGIGIGIENAIAVSSRPTPIAQHHCKRSPHSNDCALARNPAPGDGRNGSPDCNRAKSATTGSDDVLASMGQDIITPSLPRLLSRGAGAACHAGTRSGSGGPWPLSSCPLSADSESLLPSSPSLRAINASTLWGPGPRTISHTNRMTYMT